jgi:hypothetical protein
MCLANPIFSSPVPAWLFSSMAAFGTDALDVAAFLAPIPHFGRRKSIVIGSVTMTRDAASAGSASGRSGCGNMNYGIRPSNAFSE